MSLATPVKIQTLQRKLCLKAKREQDIVHASRMNLVREPDAGNPQVRFDERGAETEWMARLSETPTRKGGNSQGSHGLHRHRAAPRLYVCRAKVRCSSR